MFCWTKWRLFLGVLRQKLSNQSPTMCSNNFRKLSEWLVILSEKNRHTFIHQFYQFFLIKWYVYLVFLLNNVIINYFVIEKEFLLQYEKVSFLCNIWAACASMRLQLKQPAEFHHKASSSIKTKWRKKLML